MPIPPRPLPPRRPRAAPARHPASAHRALPLTRAGYAAVASALVTLGGCATAVGSLPVDRGADEPWCCTRGDAAVHLEYLGVGGWLLRVDDASAAGNAPAPHPSLLTAPFFSNPGLLDVGVGRIEPDTAAIERYLPPVEDVAAVLVGHSHYDHLMDLPYILRERAPEARMYGSRTAVNLLRGTPGLDPRRLESVEERAGDHENPGEWIHTADGRIRFMALRSGHAPHFMGIHLYQGQLEEPADRLPRRAGGWVEGTPLAYLIDVLSPEGEVVYRIHYQDAASTPPDGFPPSLDDGIPVDLAILCAPGYEEVDGYPEGILARLEPEHVLVGHWEDFFRSRDEEIRAVPGTDLEGFIERMRDALPADARWSMPEPGAAIRVAPGGGG